MDAYVHQRAATHDFTRGTCLSQASGRQCPEREVLLCMYAHSPYLSTRACSSVHVWAHLMPLHDTPVCLICGCHWLQVKYDLLIGADGVGSTVRSEMEHQLPGMSGACFRMRLGLCFSLSLQSIICSDCCAQICAECAWSKLLLLLWLAADVDDGAVVPPHEAHKQIIHCESALGYSASPI